MKNKKQIEKQIKESYKSNVKFLDKQFKKQNDENIITILLENINTIDTENTFTEKELLDGIIGLTTCMNYIDNKEHIIDYFKMLNYTWIEEMKNNHLNELYNEAD